MASFEQKVEALVDSILLDYQKGRDIDRIGHEQYPDREVIVEMADKLMRILYPGYSTDKTYRIYNAKHNLSMLIEDVVYHLNQQISLVMEDSEAICIAFMEQIPRIREVAQTDVDAAFMGDPAATNADEIIYCYPGLFAISIYRLAHVLYELQVPMIPRIMTEYAHNVTGIDIHPGATIGDHFFIDHGTGIVIGQTTVIGSYVRIYQGVTLGGLTTRGGQSLRGERRHPTIEDNVTIYANASILGGNTVIGHDSIVGAYAFITRSIPPCTTVTNQSQQLNMKQHHCDDCPKTEQ